MRISDWSSDVCSFDLDAPQAGAREASTPLAAEDRKVAAATVLASTADAEEEVKARLAQAERLAALEKRFEALDARSGMALANRARRSEERRVGKECGSTGRSRWSPYH